MDLHLMIIKECLYDCPLCCNKQYDIDAVPLVKTEDIKNAKMVLLTGGEPLLFPQLVCSTAMAIRKIWKEARKEEGNLEYLNRKIIVYTTGALLDSSPSSLAPMRGIIDGFSISPKSVNDWISVYKPNVKDFLENFKSNRIYVFETFDKYFRDRVEIDFPHIEIITRKWQKQFKPAPDSMFRRLSSII